MTNDVKLLRLKAVLAQTGLSRSPLYRLMAAGRFPKPVALAGTQVKVWRSDVVEAWVEQHTAAQRGQEN